jgi:hypothetical protein
LKIGIWNLEPKIENTASMQVAQYHKQRGDSVELYSPLFSYDKVYVFSIFSFTKKPKLKSNMIAGGTGFDVKSRLPIEIESCDLDYSIYPYCETSYLWYSRGCVNHCPFCVVPTKEGPIYPVEPKNINPKGKYITIVDNSFFDSPKWREALKQLSELNQPVLFASGINVRTLDDTKCAALASLKLYRRLHIAWDNPKENIIPNIKLLKKYIPSWKISCYVLIGYWSTQEEDQMRVNELDRENIQPFIMPFNKQDQYQKAYTRYVNRLKSVRIRKNVSFKMYCERESPKLLARLKF